MSMTIDEIEVEIDVVSRKIEDSKTQKAECQGSIDTNLRRLKDEFGISSEKEAEKFLSDTSKEIEEIEGKMSESFEILKKRIGL